MTTRGEEIKEAVLELSTRDLSLGGHAFVWLNRPFEPVPTDKGWMIPAHRPLERDGKEISRRRLRESLWDLRGSKFVLEGEAVIWAAYDREDDCTFFGVGYLTDERRVRDLAMELGLEPVELG